MRELGETNKVNNQQSRIMEQKKEEKLKEATTKQAIVLIAWYNWCIIKNIGRAIDNIVRKFPWICVLATIVIAFVVSFVFISKARAERDSYNKRYANTQMQLDSYKACYDDGKEVK